MSSTQSHANNGHDRDGLDSTRHLQQSNDATAKRNAVQSSEVSAVSVGGMAASTAADPSSASNSAPTGSSVSAGWEPWRARTIALYKREKFQMIGEGTYGAVFLAHNNDNQLVALKKIRKEKKEGFPITAIREIKILKSLTHHNVVALLDVVSSGAWWQPAKLSPEEARTWDSSVYMVFEYCDHDLTGLMEAKIQMSPAQIKYYIREVLRGLDYLHSNKIIHRDIKGKQMHMLLHCPERHQVDTDNYVGMPVSHRCQHPHLQQRRCQDCRLCMSFIALYSVTLACCLHQLLTNMN